jgi:hypothetical protein
MWRKDVYKKVSKRWQLDQGENLRALKIGSMGLRVPE